MTFVGFIVVFAVGFFVGAELKKQSFLKAPGVKEALKKNAEEALREMNKK